MRKRAMKRGRLLAAALAIAASRAQAVEDRADNVLEEIIVRAALRPVRAADLPASVTVLDQDVVRRAGQQSFADLTAMVPNLNWAGDSSRPRYFQLRGVGELEQYQGAPNASVGFLIDFAGLQADLGQHQRHLGTGKLFTLGPEEAKVQQFDLLIFELDDPGQTRIFSLQIDDDLARSKR